MGRCALSQSLYICHCASVCEVVAAQFISPCLSWWVEPSWVLAFWDLKALSLQAWHKRTGEWRASPMICYNGNDSFDYTKLLALERAIPALDLTNLSTLFSLKMLCRRQQTRSLLARLEQHEFFNGSWEREIYPYKRVDIAFGGNQHEPARHDNYVHSIAIICQRLRKWLEGCLWGRC